MDRNDMRSCNWKFFFPIHFSGTMKHIAITINCWELVLFDNIYNIKSVFFRSQLHHHFGVLFPFLTGYGLRTMCERYTYFFHWKAFFLWVVNKFGLFQSARQLALYSGNQHVLYANLHLFVVLIHIYPHIVFLFYSIFSPSFTIHIKRIFKSIILVFVFG